MTSAAPPSPFPPSALAADDIVEATERLFLEIAEAAGNEAVRQAILTINEQMHSIRPYEAAFISDRQAEFEALSSSWASRDMPELRRLIMVYFERRQDITPQLVSLINNPN
ncbi:hypothetical protein [Asticcacaulis sp.]|uniref:hypothetical protein n=1 Tax=Asticcacaulis sp. TaxID=1872648 RepID=UPI002C1E2577|nr:hypothetical protein [Asticcacaulis sp.]HTM81570.1 hypothetical protein [Asticcacaulis sp.]